jgi:site-specific recombinase XerD
MFAGKSVLCWRNACAAASRRSSSSSSKPRLAHLSDSVLLHTNAYVVANRAIVCRRPDIEPLHVAAYIEALGKDFEKPTVKQHLAAIRMLFDWLVTGQVVATNPAHAVREDAMVVSDI